MTIAYLLHTSEKSIYKLMITDWARSEHKKILHIILILSIPLPSVRLFGEGFLAGYFPHKGNKVIVFLDVSILAVGETGYVVFGDGGEGDLVFFCEDLFFKGIENGGLGIAFAPDIGQDHTTESVLLKIHDAVKFILPGVMSCFDAFDVLPHFP